MRPYGVTSLQWVKKITRLQVQKLCNVLLKLSCWHFSKISLFQKQAHFNIEATWVIPEFITRGKLPACTTATAHTLAFEFDLVMDLMAIFSIKQTEVSTGEKTYDMTVYEIWKHAAWSKLAVKSWQYVEHPVGWMLFAWHFFNHHLDTEKRLSTITMRWLGKPQQKTNVLSVSIHSTILYH